MNKEDIKQKKAISMEIASNEILEKMIVEKIKREMARRLFRHYVEYMMPDFTFSKFNLELIQLLQDCYDWKITRLIVNMPPRHWKTLLISQLFPSWVLWNKWNEEFVNVWYWLWLSKESSRKCLDLTKLEKYKILFPDFNVKTETAQDWRCWGVWSDEWWYYAVWVWGWLTWRWFTYWIIDDPIKDRADAESITLQQKTIDRYTSTFLTRKQITKKKPNKIVIILVMTRWNINDLTWYVEEIEKIWGDKFVKHIYQAINDETWEVLFPELFTLAHYEKEKINSGPRDREAMFQQNPIKSMGQIFKKEYFKYFYRSDFEKVDWLKKTDFVWWIHIDPAFSTNKNSDDTVIMLVWQSKITKDFFVRDIDGWTVSPTEAYSKILNMVIRSEIESIKIQYISIEQVPINHNQTLFKKNFLEYVKNNNRTFVIIEYNPKENKQDRILWLLEWKFQQWSINFLNHNDSKRNQLFKTLEDELLKFPTMKHDDYPDCLAQSIEQLPKRLNNLWVSDIKKSYKEVQVNPYTGESYYD